MTSSVFTTGAFLEKVKIKGVWRWVVSEFEDNTYIDGELATFFTVAATAETLLRPDIEGDNV